MTPGHLYFQPESSPPAGQRHFTSAQVLSTLEESVALGFFERGVRVGEGRDGLHCGCPSSTLYCPLQTVMIS